MVITARFCSPRINCAEGKFCAGLVLQKTSDFGMVEDYNRMVTAHGHGLLILKCVDFCSPDQFGSTFRCA